MSICQKLIDTSNAFLEWFNNSYTCIEFMDYLPSMGVIFVVHPYKTLTVPINVFHYFVRADLVLLYGTENDVKRPQLC